MLMSLLMNWHTRGLVTLLVSLIHSTLYACQVAIAFRRDSTGAAFGKYLYMNAC